MRKADGRQGGILLTGGSGLVGRALTAEITRRGLRLVQGVRSGGGSTNDAALQVRWQPEAAKPFADTAPLEGVDVAIHLSGANLAGSRWTAAYKREIVSSRTVSTAAIARTLASLEQPPRLLISASAVGIYGDRGDELLTEDSALGPADDFLTATCKAWEQATVDASAHGIRVIHLRLGVVLDPGGGALAKMLPLFRAGLGGRLGSGQQWMSWIAIDDLVRAVMHLAGYGAGPAADVPEVSPKLSSRVDAIAGPVNCISPAPVTNAEYTRALASTLHRPAFATAPAFALRLALGEMADAALLASCRAVPQALLASGFRFRFPEIGPALAHLLR